MGEEEAVVEEEEVDIQLAEHILTLVGGLKGAVYVTVQVYLECADMESLPDAELRVYCDQTEARGTHALLFPVRPRVVEDVALAGRVFLLVLLVLAVRSGRVMVVVLSEGPADTVIRSARADAGVNERRTEEEGWREREHAEIDESRDFGVDGGRAGDEGQQPGKHAWCMP